MPKGKTYKKPRVDDILKYSLRDVMENIKVPYLCSGGSKRSVVFGVPEVSNIWETDVIVSYKCSLQFLFKNIRLFLLKYGLCVFYSRLI